MAEEKPQLPDPPVNVTVIGKPVGLESEITAKTPAGMPNLTVKIVSPLLAIVTRFGHLYLTVFVGLLAASLTPTGADVMEKVGAATFWETCKVCADLSLPAAMLGLFKDLVTVFGKLEAKFPLLTGNV